ncbi:protein of unknown function [Hyphomicrobium sp. 1Nfss2.1]
MAQRPWGRGRRLARACSGRRQSRCRRRRLAHHPSYQNRVHQLVRLWPGFGRQRFLASSLGTLIQELIDTSDGLLRTADDRRRVVGVGWLVVGFCDGCRLRKRWGP